MSNINPLERLRSAMDWQDKIQARVKREFVDAESLSEEELRSRIRGKELDEQQLAMAMAIFNEQGIKTTAEMFKYVIEIRQGLEELESLGWWERRKHTELIDSLRAMHQLLETAWYSLALIMVLKQKRQTDA